MKVDIRAATAGDAIAIAALEAHAAHHPWSLASVQDMLALETTVGWLATHPAPCGYLLASEVVGEGELLTIGVHPAVRRRGIAHRLMEALECHWQTNQVSRGFLEVRADNTPARSLYRTRGWRETGRRSDYYGPGDDAVNMMWEAR